MEIISHRGYWLDLNERNTPQAFRKSFSCGFGTETDIRDYCGDLVISHDIATSDSILMSDFLRIFNSYDSNNTLALNIKADGLQKKLKPLLEANRITDYFVFDMSIPDTLGYLNEGIPFFSRQSEYEPNPVFYKECSGVWLDCFEGIWFDIQLIENHLRSGKKIAIVSPELHKRNHLELWEFIRENDIDSYKELILCTDIPEQAVNFFNKL